MRKVGAGMSLQYILFFYLTIKKATGLCFYYTTQNHFDKSAASA